MARINASPRSRKKVLFLGLPSSLYTTRRMILERAGYNVIACSTEAEALAYLEREEFNLLIFGASLIGVEVNEIIRQARRRSPSLPVLSLNPKLRPADVDVQLTRLEKPDTLLKVAGELMMRNHGHPELKGDLIVYADADRHLISVSDGVCELLDYGREELIGMQIEEISEAPASEVQQMFAKYLRQGKDAGLYTLKKSNGKKIPIRYKAKVMKDGCMVAQWKVL